MGHRHRHPARVAALVVVLALPLAGVAGTAAAAQSLSCARHAHAKRCQGSGTASTPQIVVTASPDPLVETGPSQVRAVVEVETLPQFAGDEVTISSSQLVASCATNPNPVQFLSNAGGGGRPPGFYTNTITVALDDLGNATVALYATDCAPGQDLIEADLDVAPFLTALTTLVVVPPAVTTEGLEAYPNDEVETGDSSNIAQPSGESDVYAVFYVETNPVYAETRVVMNSTQLESRCGAGYWFQGANGGTAVSMSTGVPTANGPISNLDDDGNAVFVFVGASCAAGDSVVSADVEAGTHPTYTVDYTILPPAVTI